MTTPLTTVARVLGSLCPSIPRAFEVYSWFREPKQVTCPENGEPARVRVDAKRAAATAMVGMPEPSNHSLCRVASRLWSRLPVSAQ